MNKILIYRLGSLGDTALVLPCFHYIRKQFPDAHICVLTNIPVNPKAPHLVSVLENTSLYDSVMDYPISLRDPKALYQLYRCIARERFDRVYHLAAPRGFLKSIRDWLFFRLCGIKSIVGIALKGEDLNCRFLEDKQLFEWEAARLARRVSRNGETLDLGESDNWDLVFSKDELAEAENILAAIDLGVDPIACCIGTKLAEKDWGSENWEHLLEQLGKSYGDKGLVLLGAPDEFERSEKCKGEWPGPGLNLCGKVTPRVSAAIIKRCGLFLGHDSGPMHLAGLVGTPCVALFAGNNFPGQWYPRGAGHSILFPGKVHKGYVPCTGDKSLIGSITLDEVFEKVDLFLGKKGER